jgi:hypothetical protein
MTNASKLRTPAALVLAAGGFCWTTKMAVIAATDGATRGIPDTVTAILWFAGVALMAIGMGAVAVALLDRRHIALRILAGLAGPFAWAVTYMALETAAQGLVGEGAGPSWLHEEIGILATGVALMATGLWLARPRLPVGQVSFG